MDHALWLSVLKVNVYYRSGTLWLLLQLPDNNICKNDSTANDNRSIMDI